MIVEILLWVAMMILLWLAFAKKPSGLPPGKWGLPLIGYIPLNRKTLHQQIYDMRDKYGDIFVWRMGMQTMLFIHDYKLVKEAFNRPEMVSRVDWPSRNFTGKKEYGVFSSNGIHWQNNRRFTLKTLKDLGMGKSTLVDAMHTQATHMVQELKKQAGTIAHLPHALRVCVVNIIWQMVGSRQFTVTDPRLIAFEDAMTGEVRSFGRRKVPDFFTWLYKIMPASLLRRVFAFDRTEYFRDTLHSFFDEEIAEHRATLDPANPRDMIDCYLIEMEERKNDPANTFCERDMKALLVDMFLAGSESTSNSLIWMIYYLATNTEAQRKMQAEIDKVLPNGIMATLADKNRLPYTEAVMNETMRKNALTAFGVQHMASEDTKLGGYNIPKGTIINSAIYSIHHDEKIWDNPHEFRPERWLDNEGNFAPQKIGFLPFSVGKRVCAGEALARTELLIFSTAVFQNFNIAIPPGKTLSLEPGPGNPFFRRYVLQDLLITVRD